MVSGDGVMMVMMVMMVVLMVAMVVMMVMMVVVMVVVRPDGMRDGEDAAPMAVATSPSTLGGKCASDIYLGGEYAASNVAASNVAAKNG